MGVMKMGNIVPRVGIEPTSLAFRTSVLTVTTCRLQRCHHYTHGYLSKELFASEVSADYYINVRERSLLREEGRRQWEGAGWAIYGVVGGVAGAALTSQPCYLAAACIH